MLRSANTSAVGWVKPTMAALAAQYAAHEAHNAADAQHIDRVLAYFDSKIMPLTSAERGQRWESPSKLQRCAGATQVHLMKRDMISKTPAPALLTVLLSERRSCMGPCVKKSLSAFVGDWSTHNGKERGPHITTRPVHQTVCSNNSAIPHAVPSRSSTTVATDIYVPQ